MRLLSVRPKRGGAARLALLLAPGQVLDIGAAAARARLRLPFDAGDMISLIASGRSGLAALRRLAKALSTLRVLAPIPRPRKNVFCVGWNYLEHFEEGAKARTQQQEMPQHPTFFTKVPTAVTGPYDPVPLHVGVTDKLDWEVELGVIIGRGGRNIPESQALKHVFGYTVINDVSAREVQRRHGQQWFKGKSLDGSCPMGPWIVTADEIADPHALGVRCRVNGATKQDANTRQMYFRIPRIIAELSAGLTLEPGDVISTGTPAGVGHARTPPEFLAPGDLLETEVEGIGVLKNRVVRA
jgi:2-keto-4-pentenoate hydratase/2-oxohepta-3-ene-1,7-dioic acid hydratase in catechol pathway